MHRLKSIFILFCRMPVTPDFMIELFMEATSYTTPPNTYSVKSSHFQHFNRYIASICSRIILLFPQFF